jgi:UTP--glucose-1-phosphate uridylyltransferase
LHQYGVVACSGSNQQIDRIVEKPRQGTAPSNRAVIGRYLLQPSIFTHLQQCGIGAGGELQLTDAIASLLRRESVMAVDLAGKRFDCGSKIGFLEANISFGLRHPVLGKQLSHFLSKKLPEVLD